MKWKKIVAAALSVALCVVRLPLEGVMAVSHARVSVHDPSIVKLADGSYYIIGSHLAAATSSDLCSWTYTANSDKGTTNTTYFSDIYTDLAVPESWSNTTDGYDLSGNLWAPDIIYNESMGKYCMYLSVNGENWNSSIVLCTADDIDGPYTYEGTIVYSGFTTGSVNNASLTDVYEVLGYDADLSRYLTNTGSWDASYGTNAIDPCVFYDEDGKLWMIYGSWFGGLIMLELDEATGLRDYTVTYETVTNESDAYMGKKVAGGYYSSGEGPYITYIEDSDTGVGYYYLFVSYGYYNTNGGYNIRVFRSENPDGPYYDENGNSSIFTQWNYNITGTTGQRLMSNYQWSEDSTIYRAQGHNSAFVDDDGSIYLIYHTKFDDSYGFHEVRVHQMFLNEDGWLTVAPYEYSGESVSSSGYSESVVVGTYDFIFHTLNQNFVNEVSSDVETPSTITLNSDGTITGDITGTWTMDSDSANMSLTFDGVTYKGTFLVQADETASQTQHVVFTATGNNTCVWGSNQATYDPTLDGVDISTSSLLTYDATLSSYETSANLTVGDTELLSDVSYHITSKYNGLRLQVAEDSNLEQWESVDTSAQEWRIVDLGDGYCKIVSMSDETLAITVDGNSATNGLNIKLASYTGSDSQKWKLIEEDGYFGIVSKCSNDSAGLDVYGWSSANGGNIDQWEYWSGDCQMWSITLVFPQVVDGSYYLRSVNSGLYLACEEDNVVQASTESWYLRKNEDGTYAIISEDGLAITIENGDATDGNNACLSRYTGDESQKFHILPSSDGSYVILSVVSGQASCLDVYGISIESGANICQWSYWGGDWQKWVLIPSGESEPTLQTENPSEPEEEPSDTSTDPVSIVYGDTDENGLVDVRDVILLSQVVGGTASISEQGAINADVDLNSYLDNTDCISILRSLTELTSLPVV